MGSVTVIKGSEPAWPGLVYVLDIQGFSGTVRVVDDVIYSPTSFGVPLPEGAPVGEYARMEWEMPAERSWIQVWGVGTHRIRVYTKGNKARALTHLDVYPHHDWRELQCFWYTPPPREYLGPETGPQNPTQCS